MEGNLLAAAGAEPARTLMVVSGSGGEGRTTAAACLGWALAASGPTLLVDAHNHRPGLSALFNTPHAPGLSEMALEELSPIDGVRPTEVENLWLLPAGRRVAGSASLFHRESFSRLIGQLKRDWQYVLLDTPPLLSASDAAVMARDIDGAVMVIEAERTREDDARAVAERLVAVRCRLLAAILNRRRSHMPRFLDRML